MEMLVDRKPPLRFGERMRREHKYDGFMSIIVEGKQRIGKSSYVSQSGAEALGEWDKDGDMLYCAKADYESLKKYIVFRPVDFLNLVLRKSPRRFALSSGMMQAFDSSPLRENSVEKWDRSWSSRQVTHVVR